MATYKASGMFRVVFASPNSRPATFFLDDASREVTGLLLSPPRENKTILPEPYVVLYGSRSRYRNLPYNLAGLYGPLVIVKEDQGEYVPMDVEEIVTVSLALDHARDLEKKHIWMVQQEQNEHEEHEMASSIQDRSPDGLLRCLGQE